jgi:Holliday junction resolvase-like predicted endonuclease
LHTYRISSEAIPEFVIVRVLVQALKLSRNGATVSLVEIAKGAGTTTLFAERILEESIDLSDAKLTIVDSSTRFKLAIQAVKLGALLQVARALTWQEFEEFCEECLGTAGFHTRRGVILKDNFRRWQIDVIAKKGSMILVVDCKHWESPGYYSKLVKAAEHQKLAVQALVQQMIVRGEVERAGILALPIILTLFEPRSRVVNGIVVVSVEQFAEFLGGISPYSSELPFIPVQSVAKSSIS